MGLSLRELFYAGLFSFSTKIQSLIMFFLRAIFSYSIIDSCILCIQTALHLVHAFCNVPLYVSFFPEHNNFRKERS